jgi:hypothetical protein
MFKTRLPVTSYRPQAFTQPAVRFDTQPLPSQGEIRLVPVEHDPFAPQLIAVDYTPEFVD